MPPPHRMVIHLLTLCTVVLGASADAQDRLSIDGMVDLRWVQASGEMAYLNGGLGDVRFDPSHDGLELGRAMLAPNWRVTDTTSIHAVLDAYGDHDGHAVDVSEFYMNVRPFPTSALRWRVRMGAFFMPVSLENRGIGWSAVYSITPSAVNTWIGEEFRTIGAELEARWLGASVGYLGDVAFVAAVYGWNDPAGTLIAQRGFALSDRPSPLIGGLGSPPIGFYHDIDHRAGYYAGVSWKHHDRVEVRLLHYDNRGNPAATDAAGNGAWQTLFSSYGVRLEPSAHLTFIAQALDGNTAVGSPGADQFHMRFRAAFALGSFEWARERITVRYDEFSTHQLTAYYSDASNQTGHSWTYAASHEWGEQWQLSAEWLRVASRFPPRSELGMLAAQVQSQYQLSLRYKFTLGW